MEMLTANEHVALALVKREAACGYIRKRHMLRAAVKAGIFAPSYVRTVSAEVREHVTTWRAARALLKG